MRAVVVGAGIVGSSVAYRLAASGAEVVVVESGTPGAGASATSFAWVNSNNVTHPAYHALRCLAMAAYRELATDLGSDGWLHEVGNLHLAFDGPGAASLRTRVARLRSLGYPAELVSPDFVRRAEPSLRLPASPVTAAHYPAESYVDSTPLIGALLRAASARAVRARARTLLRDGAHRVIGVGLNDGDELTADAVILCTGSAPDLAEGVGDLRGAVGASVVTAPVPVPVSGMVHLPGLTLRPDGNGRLFLRDTDVDAMVDTETMRLGDEGVEVLLDRARAVLDVHPADLVAAETRVSYRPRPGDGLPIVGPSRDGVYLVVTHSGVTLGALLGRLVADEILTGEAEPLLEPFRPTRTMVPAADNVETERA